MGLGFSLIVRGYTLLHLGFGGASYILVGGGGDQLLSGVGLVQRTDEVGGCVALEFAGGGLLGGVAVFLLWVGRRWANRRTSWLSTHRVVGAGGRSGRGWEGVGYLVFSAVSNSKEISMTGFASCTSRSRTERLKADNNSV
ncbi:hypothetical protein Tco_0844026 [Tanacetum coccineum]